MNAILGAGIAGLSAAYHLGIAGKSSIVYEQRNTWGGLCDNFTISKFRFDYGIHLSFTGNEYVKSLFAKSVDCYKHTPSISNYYKGYWVKHPAQNNLYALSVDEKVKIIMDFMKRKERLEKNDLEIESYEQWLRYQYGDYFAENFPMLYTLKYWTIPASKLTTEWIGSRMYLPSIEEVLSGAMTSKTPNTYYASEMRYPMRGGFKEFLKEMASNCNIQLRKKAILIDIDRKRIDFDDGSSIFYSNLFSSLPMPEIVRIIKDCPRDILKSAEELSFTSVALVSLGFNRVDIPKYLWFYIYDDDILPARAYSANLKSPDNVPDGCSSMQFEVYYSKYKRLEMNNDSLIEHIVKRFNDMRQFTKNDIVISDCREVKYANVIFDNKLKSHRAKINSFLADKGIKSIGRFGQWDYMWTDQSLLSGKSAAESIKEG